MERLTKIDGAGRNIIEVKRFAGDDDWIISEMADGITIKFSSKAIDKLAEFENFMEELGYESLEHLEFALEEQNKIIEAYEQENQALKDRWEKLKESVDASGCFLDDGSFSGDVVISIYAILDKMQELEQGESNAKD